MRNYEHCMESNANKQKLHTNLNLRFIDFFFNFPAPHAQNFGPYTTLRPQFQVQVYNTEAWGCINVMINNSEVRISCKPLQQCTFNSQV
jgi:hypothetical protein